MDNSNTLQSIKLKLTDGREINYSGPIQFTQQDLDNKVNITDITFNEGKELPEGMKWTTTEEEIKDKEVFEHGGRGY